MSNVYCTQSTLGHWWPQREPGPRGGGRGSASQEAEMWRTGARGQRSSGAGDTREGLHGSATFTFQDKQMGQRKTGMTARTAGRLRSGRPGCRTQEDFVPGPVTS